MDLFVYYDVLHERATAARERIHMLHTELGCAARLMRRAEAGEQGTTWMEIYEGVAPGFDERLASAVERHGLAALTGARHIERFVAVD